MQLRDDQLIRLSDHHRRRRIFFTRAELNRLLGIYSRRVAAGLWRDYAIDQQPGSVIFSIFRSSLERPLYSIAKHAGAGQQAAQFVLMSGRQVLTQSRTLDEVIELLERRPTLVPV